MTKTDKDAGMVFEDFVKTLRVTSETREEVVRSVVLEFLNEKKGYWKEGKQIATRYTYFVEELAGGERIYLRRPAHPKGGMDFQVFVEEFLGGDKDRRPSHDDVLTDVVNKLSENSEQGPALRDAIERVWNCEDPDLVLSKTNLTFTKGLANDALLKILKWLFIEQDITYWSYDGRMKLLKSLYEVLP